MIKFKIGAWIQALTLPFLFCVSVCAETLPIRPGATSICVPLEVKHSTTGAGLTGLAHNTASLTCYYWRDTAASPTQISLVDATVGTFTSGGFKEISSANMPGKYTLCLPNAAIATGARTVVVECKGAANMAEADVTIALGMFSDMVNAVLDEPVNPAHMTPDTAGFKLNQAASLQLTCDVTN